MVEGRSLLEPDAVQEIPIIGTRVWEDFDFEKENQYERAPISGMISPLYLFGRISVIYCDASLNFLMKDNVVERDRIAGHTGGCERTVVPEDAEFRRFVRDQFLRTGFDVSWLVD